jgi:DNA-binding NarL/FixJ family response regulator
LARLERTPADARELRSAYETFHSLGAALESERALRLLRGLDTGALPASAEAGGLSRREVEVLCLLAAGKSNHQIAGELVLSIRTVERHISTIYEKLGLQGPGARAAATAFAHSHSLIVK